MRPTAVASGLCRCRLLALLLVVVCGANSSRATEPHASTASGIASRLASLQHNGSSYIRVKMDIRQGQDAQTLQVQILQRRSPSSTEVVCQVLWPKERQGESLLLRKVGRNAPTGVRFVPPDKMLTPDALDEPLLGSDLALADLMENSYTWDHQAIVGKEKIGNLPCLILESKPGNGQHSIYTAVRTWVDETRLLPLRVEKFMGSGKLARRIETTRFTRNEEGAEIPANLSIQSQRDGSVTTMEGSRLNTRVTFADGDFTPKALRIIHKAKSASEAAAAPTRE